MAPGAQAATFTVSKIADTNDGTCDADCSLREAIITANTSVGVPDDITLPAGIYTLTIPGSLEDLAATGDLDIRDTVTINGAGSATTIIQAGNTNANGIDKVFSVNQTATTNASATFNLVTVRFGRNTNPLDAGFNHLGAGIDFFGSSGTPTACGSETLTITNSVITENSVDNVASPNGGVGAGVSADNGALVITNSTIANNQTTNQVGGGISHHGGGCTLTITNSNVSGNQAKGGSNGEGGGIFVRQAINGTVTIRNSTIVSNTSESRGGGIKLESTPGPLTATIDQQTLITGNTSLGTGTGISEGGGVDISTLDASTTTLKDVTITNNHADDTLGGASGGGKGGGIFHNLGTLNVSLSRITGNTAPMGSGLFRAAGTVTAENNWWGCDELPGSGAGPDVNGCDTVDGTADVDPRLDLKVTALPSTIPEGGTSSVTADFLTNSAGAAVAPVVLNGLPIAFGETYGNMNPTSAPLTGFMATSVYTNESCPSTPPEMVMATLDNGTDAADVIITCATTTTTTTSTTTTTEPPTTTSTTSTTEAPTTTTTSSTTTTTMPPPLTCGGRTPTIVGTPGNNTITGTSGNDVIHGLGGNDIINGGNGDDVICGGDGNDALNGNNGIDRLFGENSNDALNGNNGNDALDGGAQTDTCNGGNGSDTAAACESVTSVP